MDPLSITFGTIGVTGVGAQVLQTAHDLRSNYRDAHPQIIHAQSQLAMLQSNLKDLVLQSNLKFSAAQSSFETISGGFPIDLRFDKKGKFLWAWKYKRQVSELVSQLKETETSTTLALQLEQKKEIEDIKSTLSEALLEQFEVMKSMERELQEQQIWIQMGVTSFNSSGSSRRQDRAAETRILRWNSRLSNYLDAEAFLITSKVNGESRSKTLFRWRAFSFVWSSWLSWSLYPRFTLQKIIEKESPAVAACCRNDAQLMRRVLTSGAARPNDVTEENRTLLHLAIREGSFETINLLLDSGADPNLTCGDWETSPLNTAFYYGDVDTVRRLLNSRAELEYINGRLWTSPRYLFDPEISKLHTIELLDICAEHDFDQWDAPDMQGWTIFHRASAFGQACDLQKLLHLRAASDMYTFTLKWLPIFCAVYCGNESTFDFLVNLIPPWILPTLRDARGWSLLHLAAQNGSEAIMTRLLQRNLDPHCKTDRSALALPEGLALKELTASDIANICNHQAAYEKALKIADNGVT